MKNRREQVRTIVLERRNRLADLKANLVEGMTLSNATKDSWVILLQDASKPGMYRHQSFRINGFYGHSTHGTLEKALEDAFQCGYAYEDEGALDRVAQTEEWRRGILQLDVIQRYNSDLITMDQVRKEMKDIAENTFSC